MRRTVMMILMVAFIAWVLIAKPDKSGGVEIPPCKEQPVRSYGEKVGDKL